MKTAVAAFHYYCCCCSCHFPPHRLMMISCGLLIVLLVVSQTFSTTSAAPADDSNSIHANPRAWPAMKNYDIWSNIASNDEDNDDTIYYAKPVNGNDNIQEYQQKSISVDFKTFKNRNDDDGGMEYIENIFDHDHDLLMNETRADRSKSNKRESKVLHLFPVPVDGECLSDDGRRTGTCFNAYECRLKGGIAKGECAMGFGVCCIFMAICNQTISNNITYLVSPNFPSFMAENFTACTLKVNLMNADISQLRIDFLHFSLGQPNRRTGVCDGDVFNISGGPGGTFTLCGQNSGQHIYYDIGGRELPRQTLYASLRPLTYDQIYPNWNGSNETSLKISLSFSKRFLPIRLWEIRIAQIPFSQRAPAGCQQYYTGTEGIIQTFNFADNGRHLANQRYRICMRQEVQMCSIVYQPCDEQSFRIGPTVSIRSGDEFQNVLINSATTSFVPTPASISAEATAADPTIAVTNSTATTAGINTTTTPAITTTPTTTILATTTTPDTTATNLADALNSTEEITTTTTTTTSIPSSSILNDDIEGSGDDADISTPSSTFSVSRVPRPVHGGFDILGFLLGAFRNSRSIALVEEGREEEEHDKEKIEVVGKEQVQTNQQLLHQTKLHQRQNRQFFTTCTDRITMPCVIEDFIGAGLGPLPGCEPVHCGSQFCSSSINPCRIESTVTPFYIGVNFGDGESKGSAEDNIGVCLRYSQVQCL